MAGFISKEKLERVLKERGLTLQDIHDKLDKDLGEYNVRQFCSGEVSPYPLFWDILIDWLGCHHEDLEDREASERLRNRRREQMKYLMSHPRVTINISF